MPLPNDTGNPWDWVLQPKKKPVTVATPEPKVTPIAYTPPTLTPSTARITAAITATTPTQASQTATYGNTQGNKTKASKTNKPQIYVPPSPRTGPLDTPKPNVPAPAGYQYTLQEKSTPVGSSRFEWALTPANIQRTYLPLVGNVGNEPMSMIQNNSSFFNLTPTTSPLASGFVSNEGIAQTTQTDVNADPNFGGGSGGGGGGSSGSSESPEMLGELAWWANADSIQPLLRNWAVWLQEFVESNRATIAVPNPFALDVEAEAAAIEIAPNTSTVVGQRTTTDVIRSLQKRLGITFGEEDDITSKWQKVINAVPTADLQAQQELASLRFDETSGQWYTVGIDQLVNPAYT